MSFVKVIILTFIVAVATASKRDKECFDASFPAIDIVSPGFSHVRLVLKHDSLICETPRGAHSRALKKFDSKDIILPLSVRREFELKASFPDEDSPEYPKINETRHLTLFFDGFTVYGAMTATRRHVIVGRLAESVVKKGILPLVTIPSSDGECLAMKADIRQSNRGMEFQFHYADKSDRDSQNKVYQSGQRFDSITVSPKTIWDPLEEPNSGLRCTAAKGLQAAIDEINAAMRVKGYSALEEPINSTRFDDSFLVMEPHDERRSFVEDSFVKEPQSQSPGVQILVELHHKRRINGAYVELPELSYTFKLTDGGPAKRFAFWHPGGSGQGNLERKLLYIWIKGGLKAAMANVSLTHPTENETSRDRMTCANLEEEKGGVSIMPDDMGIKAMVKEMVFYTHFDDVKNVLTEEVLLLM